MLSPRGEQPSWWHRLKTPAAVSLACLAATLLIAAQAFRSQPVTKSVVQTQPKPDAMYPSSLKTSSASGSTDPVPKAVLTSSLESAHTNSHASVQMHVDLPTGSKDLATGPHKEKEPAQTSQANLPEQHPFQNVTAYREEIAGMEVVIINDTTTGHAIKGVLLLFHGCSHSAGDWWYPSTTCPTCTGLPEELMVTKAALRHNYAVVAFSSSDRELHRCWDTTYPPEKSTDVAVVAKVWQELLDRENWGRIPHYAVGGSSGGAFVLFLAQRVPLDGVCPIIMAVQPHTLEAKPRTPDSSKSWAFPPTFFVHMERDETTAEGVAQNVAALKKQGVPVNEISVPPRPLNSTFFSDRIEGLDNTTSAAMYSALLAAEVVNGTGYLVENPRSLIAMRKWQRALRESVAATKTMNFNKDESPVFEELNLAWASHELVSDHMDEVLDWFASRKDGPKLMTAVNPRRQLLGLLG